MPTTKFQASNITDTVKSDYFLCSHIPPVFVVTINRFTHHTVLALKYSCLKNQDSFRQSLITLVLIDEIL